MRHAAPRLGSLRWFFLLLAVPLSRDVISCAIRGQLLLRTPWVHGSSLSSSPKGGADSRHKRNAIHLGVPGRFPFAF